MNETPDRPAVVARPPLLYLATLIVGLVADRLAMAGFGLADGARHTAGSVLIVAGLALAGAAIAAFRRGGTNVQTSQPALRIVAAGPYRFSRNPIYLGGTLIYAGIALLADAPVTLALLAPLLLVVRYGVIAREELYLARKFGTEYLDYKARVRRWL